MFLALLVDLDSIVLQLQGRGGTRRLEQRVWHQYAYFCFWLLQDETWDLLSVQASRPDAHGTLSGQGALHRQFRAGESTASIDRQR